MKWNCSQRPGSCDEGRSMSEMHLTTVWFGWISTRCQVHLAQCKLLICIIQYSNTEATCLQACVPIWNSFCLLAGYCSECEGMSTQFTDYGSCFTQYDFFSLCKYSISSSACYLKKATSSFEIQLLGTGVIFK